MHLGIQAVHLGIQAEHSGLELGHLGIQAGHLGIQLVRPFRNQPVLLERYAKARGSFAWVKKVHNAATHL